MTKKEAIERKARWNKALAERRVVSYGDGDTMREYLTPNDAMRAVKTAVASGQKAFIVTVAPKE